MITRFPKYLFVLTMLAEYHLQRGEYEKVPEIFSGQYNLMSLFPERTAFHVSEVLTFNSTMASYFIAIGNLQQAKIYYDLMMSLSPNAPIVLQTRERLWSGFYRKRTEELPIFR